MSTTVIRLLLVFIYLLFFISNCFSPTTTTTTTTTCLASNTSATISNENINLLPPSVSATITTTDTTTDISNSSAPPSERILVSSAYSSSIQNQSIEKEQQQQVTVPPHNGPQHRYRRQLFRGRPAFDQSLPVNVTASTWMKQAYLPCRVVDLSEQTVSWIRKSDSSVLSIDKQAFRDDGKFEPVLNQHDTHDWALIINSPQEADTGFYECQVSSLTPKISRLVYLNVVHARSQIGDGPSTPMYLRLNDKLNLTCIIEAPELPDYVCWCKNDQFVQLDRFNRRGQRWASRDPTSDLQIARHIPFITVDDHKKPKKEASVNLNGKIPTKQIIQAQTIFTTTTNNNNNNHSSMLMVMGPGRMRSNLVIDQVQANDSGNYTCLAPKCAECCEKYALASHQEHIKSPYPGYIVPFAT